MNVEPPLKTSPLFQIGGDHYAKQSLQPWDVCEAWLTPDQFTGYLWGSIIKYVGRWPHKGGVQDLLKMRHFLDKLIEHETLREKT